jgi:hypothetical protein
MKEAGTYIEASSKKQLIKGEARKRRQRRNPKTRSVNISEDNVFIVIHVCCLSLIAAQYSTGTYHFMKFHTLESNVCSVFSAFMQAGDHDQVMLKNKLERSKSLM